MKNSYVVVQNTEGKYSMCRSERLPLDGWKVASEAAQLEKCVEFLNAVMPDMLPVRRIPFVDDHADRVRH